MAREGENATSPRCTHRRRAVEERKQLPCERQCFVHPRQRAGQAAGSRVRLEECAG